MLRDDHRRCLLALAIAAMMLPMALPALGLPEVDGEVPTPEAVIPDPTLDRFEPLLPWPTNRTLYGYDWRPGGDYALIVGSGGTLLRTDASGEVERIETATEESIYDLEWRADGSEAVMVGNHSTMFSWDGDAGDLTAISLPFDQRLLGFTWNNSGDTGLAVGEGGYLARYNGSSLKLVTSGVTDFIYRVAWRPGADYALAVGDSGLVLEANESGALSEHRLDNNWGLWRVAWHPSGDYALIVGRDYSGASPSSLVVRYNASGTYDALPLPAPSPAGLRAIEFSASGGEAIIAGENSTVLLWDGSAMSDISAPEDRTLRGCGWEGDGTHAVVVGNRGVRIRYDGSDWTFVSQDPRQDLFSIAWRPQGDYGLVVGVGGFVARVSDSGMVDLSYDTEDDLYDVDWASDGSYALMCGAGGRVLRYNHGETQTTSVRTGTVTLRGISVKPGENVAMAVGDAGTALLWSNGIWTSKKKPTENRNLRDVAWRPDGEFAIIVGVSGTVLNYTGGATVETFIPQPLTFAAYFSVVWNKDGSRAMAVGSKDPTSDLDTIWVYDNRDWLQVDSSTGAPFYGAAFTADGEVGVALGSPDVIVKFSTRQGDGFRSNFRSAYTYLQRAGMHPSGRSIYFCGANGYAYRMRVGEFENSPPRVVIAAPSTGEEFSVDAPVELDGTGSSDPDAGDSLTFTWWSNRTGFLARGKVASVNITEPGWHRVTLHVDDGKGHNVSDYVIVKLVVPNYPPVPLINSPPEGATYTNDQLIVFDANGSLDPNGDNITFHWVSNLTGDIGYEERVERSLAPGHHRVILWVEDDKGEKEFVSVNITVVQANRPPNVYVTSPIEGERIDPDAQVELNASYSNDPDGDPLTFTWFSDAQGELGTGSVISVLLDVGPHLITCKVDDGKGHQVSVSLNVTVELPPNSAPAVDIVSPNPGLPLEGAVTISGTATDADGDDLVVRYAMVKRENWTAVEWDDGTGEWSFEWDTTTVENGLYTVFVEAYDGQEATEVWKQFLVSNGPPPNESPEAVLVTPSPDGAVEGRVLLEGTASDPDGDTVQRVEVRIDGGDWLRASGGNAWTFYWDTRPLVDGEHTVDVRAYDGEDFGEAVTYTFRVDNPEEDGDDGGLSTGVLVAIVAVVVVLVVVGVVLYLRASRR